MKINQFGRSMVEMLGVLAIIGVLSVGSIAGYSKAMFKYKLNKQAESFNQLITNIVRIEPQLTTSFLRGSDTKYDTQFYEKINAIPDGFTKKNGSFYDVFGNNVAVNYHRNGANGFIIHYFQYILERSGTNLTGSSLEKCRNIIQVAKEYPDDVYYVEVRSNLPAGSSSSYNSKNIGGNRYCGSKSGTSCLKNASVSQIDETCRSCESEVSCAIIVYFEPTGRGF